MKCSPILKKLTGLILLALFLTTSLFAQNNAPTFTSTPVTSVYADSAYAYTIETNDTDGDNVTVSGTTVPSWLSLENAGNGTYSDPAILGSGFNGPFGVFVDSDGKIYVADTGNNAIKRMDGDGNNIVTLGSGFSYPAGVFVDSDGKIYVADKGNHAIKRMDGDGTNIVTLGSGFYGPYCVFVDSNGKIYVADTFNNAIKRMDGDGTNIVTLGSGFTYPTGVSVDSNGNIFVSDYDNNAIIRMDGDGTNIVTLSSGFNMPMDVSVDSNGNIFVADNGNNAIKWMDYTPGDLILSGTPTDAEIGDHAITLTADDGNGGTATQSFTLNVDMSNDAPVIAQAMADITVDEDADTLLLDTDNVFDDENIAHGDSLSITAISLNTELLTVGSNSNGVFYLVFAENGNGETDIVLTATDLEGLSVNDTVHVTVNSVDDEPTTQGLADITVNEDAPDSTIGDLNTTFTDIDGDLVFSHTNSNPSVVSVSISDDDVLTLGFSPDSNGVATIIFTATNPTRAFVSDTMVVTVNAVNDAPTVDDLVIELEEDGSVEVPFSGFDIDDDSLTFVVVDEAMHGVVTDGVYSPNANFTGLDSLSYVANDGLVNSDLGMVIITVTNMNDAPFVAQAMTDITVDEDSDTLSLSIDGVFDDLDIIHGDSLTITAISLNTELIMIESEVPYLVFAENGNGETDIVVTATDSEGLSVNDTVHVTVNAVNDSPNEFNLTETDEVIAITLDELSTGSLDFEWEVAEDVDGDSIVYHYTSTLTAGSYTEQLDSSLVDTSLTLMTYRAIYDKLFAWEVTTAVLEWHVYSDDGTISVPALNGPLTLSIDISSLSVDDQLIPDVFALHQNYPNPFNPTTTLQYDLPEDAQVRIMVYDLMGREVKTLVNSQQNAGFKSITWDATNDFGQSVSAGMYFYRISAGDFHSVKKMILLK